MFFSCCSLANKCCATMHSTFSSVPAKISIHCCFFFFFCFFFCMHIRPTEGHCVLWYVEGDAGWGWQQGSEGYRERMTLCPCSQCGYVIHASRAVLCWALNVHTHLLSPTYLTRCHTNKHTHPLTLKCMHTRVHFLSPTYTFVSITRTQVHHRYTPKGRQPCGGFWRGVRTSVFGCGESPVW